MDLPTLLQKKTTSRFKPLGQIYAVLLKNEVIKVGFTTIGMKRFKAYVGIERYMLSIRIEDFRLAERILIKEAAKICGNPIKGREFFGGCEKEFVKILELSPKSKIEHGLPPEKQYLLDIENDYKEYVKLARLNEAS